MSAIFSNFVPIIKVPNMAYKKGEDRRQRTLFPDCIDDYVEQDSPTRLMDAFVDRLDMEELGFQRFVPADTGAPGYDPRDLLKLYTYGYYYEVRSSRKLARQCLINIEVMWLLCKLTPDFRTISDFRKDNKEAIEKTFREFNRFCLGEKLFSKSFVSNVPLRASFRDTKAIVRTILFPVKGHCQGDCRDGFVLSLVQHASCH